MLDSYILPPQNSHDFHSIAFDTVIGAVHLTHATPVAIDDIGLT